MKETVKIKFENFWPTFDSRNNPFVRALSSSRDVVVLDAMSKETPDILFYSNRGVPRHYKYDCLKVYFTGENDVPDFNECDYAISFQHLDFGKRHLRYPLYMLYEVDQAVCPTRLTDEDALARGFCSLVLSNSFNCDPRRLAIADAVGQYRPIAYGGRYRNNVGGPVDDKLQFIAGYKFNLALENSVADGYVTEKLLEPYAASTVPVYFGGDASCDFNPDSYINVNDWDNIDGFVEYLKRVDSDDAEYLRILRAPTNIRDTAERLDSQLERFLTDIADRRTKYVNPYGHSGVVYRRASVVAPLAASDIGSRIINRLRPNPVDTAK